MQTSQLLKKCPLTATASPQGFIYIYITCIRFILWVGHRLAYNNVGVYRWQKFIANTRLTGLLIRHGGPFALVAFKCTAVDTSQSRAKARPHVTIRVQCPDEHTLEDRHFGFETWPRIPFTDKWDVLGRHWRAFELVSIECASLPWFILLAYIMKSIRKGVNPVTSWIYNQAGWASLGILWPSRSWHAVSMHKTNRHNN